MASTFVRKWKVFHFEMETLKVKVFLCSLRSHGGCRSFNIRLDNCWTFSKQSIAMSLAVAECWEFNEGISEPWRLDQLGRHRWFLAPDYFKWILNPITSLPDMILSAGLKKPIANPLSFHGDPIAPKMLTRGKSVVWNRWLCRDEMSKNRKWYPWNLLAGKLLLGSPKTASIDIFHRKQALNTQRYELLNAPKCTSLESIE